MGIIFTFSAKIKRVAISFYDDHTLYEEGSPLTKTLQNIKIKIFFKKLKKW